ncbi:MAG: enoyl-CoA hydratase/isomerase family protein [Intrasporangium sp.]|uniref:enoyl-CoA hydratase/isomerase family protein n=1 Tax=Intrasporangium sp. TaxID=1925024 RepID=UPI002649E482|nr:enoyl-CoA hydratase/isomerase family protein [Intrasporangium sp.]MDN5794123.1 enoyl-CoA hydratase/isomerase family protein [Intrasporangium sp.]
MTVGLATQRHGSVLHLVLDAPKRRNALTRDMLHGLAEALTDIPDDVTGLVLRGEAGSFSAGADFAELNGTKDDIAYDDDVTRARTAILQCPRVVAAAIEGPCLGAAADIALACDLRVIAEDGYVQVPAVRLGLLYSPDALERHARTYPIDVVRRLFLLGERFSGPAASAAGLATSVVPHGATTAHATEVLARITRAELAAVAATKGFLDAVVTDNVDPVGWERRRIELLDSPARRRAIQAAHDHHVDRESTTTTR